MDQAKANSSRIFKAAWQKALETALMAELEPAARLRLEAIEKRARDEMALLFKELNQKAIEVLSQVQARLIMSQDEYNMGNILTAQLLLPPEMANNPPDGGKV